MGFAIGSSSAAISQLILRDLLGIRLMISPYVPIIAVVIWLFVKRSPKLGVEITHTDSTTLLWLLFPAPLALSHYVWLLLPTYLVPLLIFVLFLHRSELIWIARNYKQLMIISTALFAIATYFTIFVLTNVSPAIGLAEADLLFDVGHSVTFANFGVNENIGVAGQNLRYYKFSHLWLGPILLNTTDVGISVATTIVPLLFLLKIGMALWALTYYFSKSNRAAKISSILFYALATIPERTILEIRIAYLFPFLTLLCGGLLILKYETTKTVTSFIMISLTAFAVTYSRIFLLPAILPFIIVSLFEQTKAPQSLFKDMICRLFGFIIGTSLSLYLVFSKNPGWRVETFVMPAQSSLVSLATSVGPLLAVAISRFGILRQNNKLCIFIVSSFFVFGLLHIFAPRQYPSSTTFTLPLVIYLTIVAAVVLNTKSIFHHHSKNLFTILGFISVAIGVGYSAFYFVKENVGEPASGLIRIYWKFFLQQSHGSNIEYAALRLQLTQLLLACIIPGIGVLTCRFFGMKFRQVLVVSIVAVMFGNSIAVTTRHFLRDPSSTSPALISDEASQSRRWSDISRVAALNTARSLIPDRSTIATNFGNYESDGPNDTYIVPTELRARSYLSPQYPDTAISNTSSNYLSYLVATRKFISINFATQPDGLMLRDLQQAGVKWFIVDLERTELRDWEPWATTRFINDKVAILQIMNISN
jgi:hypothetical protein